MADTRADITIQEATWTNLYAASGIAVGTAVDVYNKGNNPCFLAIKATAPTDVRGLPLYAGPVGSSYHVATGASGLWVYCPSKLSVILIQD